MTKTENTALQMIAEAARCPEYGPDMVTPSTVRLWTSGAVQPSGTAKRLMQIYETGPEIVSKIAGGQHPEDGNAYK